MTFNCQDALPLVPAYLDGELSEARAGLLRRHLLDCSDCRLSAQSSKNVSRWFAPGRELPVTVPSGFAARVARRAFAGDRGFEDAPAPALRSAEGAQAGRVLPFVLRLTTVAAAAMLLLALGIANRDVPTGDRLRASDGVPPTAAEVERVLDALPDAYTNLEDLGVAPSADQGPADDPEPRGSGARR
jgi:anti-sigma factor RsiW